MSEKYPCTCRPASDEQCLCFPEEKKADKFLELINSANPDRHQIGPWTKPLEEWATDGRPHCWSKVEDSLGVQVWLDSGWGYLAAVKDGILLGFGKDTVTTPEVVILDRDYYGLPKYIWR